MPPRGLAKARDFDYSNVGKAGRRTGITLKEGKLDEHGMEEIEGMFSSPEKSPVRTNGHGYGNDTLNSEDMETGDSSIPEPADVLSGRRVQRNPLLLPPRSRSPMKSNMSGSPRRTPGIRSSSVAHYGPSSSPISARPSAKRALDFSHAPRLARSPPDMPLEADEPADFSDDGNHLMDDEAEDTHFAESHGDYHEGYDNVDGDSPNPQNQDDDDDENDAPVEDPEDPEDTGSEPSPSIIAKTVGRKRKNAQSKPKSSTRTQQEREADSEPAPNASAKPAPKRRGRKPKAATTEVDHDVEEDADGFRAPKRAKTSGSKGRSNLHMSVEQEQELNSVVENITNRNGPLKNRSLYILKRETPSDQSARHTRSGRVSVRPLAYWRNERCVYGDGSAEVGQRFPLSTIKEIIRTEELDTRVDRKGKQSSKKKSKSKSKSKRSKDDPSDDEDEIDNAEPWETEEGVFYGPVKKWDPKTQSATQEEEMIDVAFAPSAIETHEVKDSTFRFAKILNNVFLGSGFVDMPPGAVKRQKNSKKMHMVFFVYHGRIRVDVSGLQFSAGKGCVFQVPRGNNYSFANDYDKPAALFFTQGCVPQNKEGESDSAEPTSVPVEAPVQAPAGAKRGRPRQH
ncbi:cupin domain-containing protein, variant 1 [Blastomyces gilchristii SLH14081]|uniref:CENP-C homolog n=1 Tax=Blastomyces gilchristii (strain SLH14081) TaxID=559298 RepID=A0A179USR7_BLAGS|nr:cupin domain-containing protein [Blastomyces gilchristii SLH14081]XP_031579650.1 cupin domain-containing protein, variant 1 [Blastomyces gilchristii SLH14081]OAT11073.1 cupin domain-containing protein [Blastomyces gilchristii SLH14081]OAT11074.1 cupin domain-containing protein, variant 1 [Blastomyces gilchristii SLH14081]